MAWRMTVVIPPELEDAMRKEEHETRVPISRIIRSMLETRDACKVTAQKVSKFRRRRSVRPTAAEPHSNA